MIPDRDAREVNVDGAPLVRMRRKPYFLPMMAFLMGALVFLSVAGRPSFQAYRAVDVVSLIGVGMLFGVSWARTVSLFRGRARAH